MFSEHVYVNRNIVYWYKIYSLYASKNYIKDYRVWTCWDWASLNETLIFQVSGILEITTALSDSAASFSDELLTLYTCYVLPIY